ncbi:hypothetical protein PI124_g21354 [Phytophthora idaei]|nr:hypothetical protein PI125_g19312 [Phytophthora idaei]KAG3129139.1 hypothetical protein PI126_g21095 [Phytophthora idaei]KAG3233572.1 hypothetical protein PI124_g21354 [Phytophthora idaei]
MLFGFTDAPWVYQATINIYCWGFIRLSPEEEAEVAQDVMEVMGRVPENTNPGVSTLEVPALTDNVTVFLRNIPALAIMGPVLGRNSYIDGIAHGAATWDQFCVDLNTLLFRLRYYWIISVSLPKSEFEKLTIPYLSHEISAEGVRATPEITIGIQDTAFPSTLNGV